MKLLFDQNLSRHLVRQLNDVFNGSQHVALIGMSTATDDEIWAFAAAQDFVIVSKDADFQFRSLRLGPPPKVVIVEVGNGPTSAVHELLKSRREDIETFAKSDQSLLILS